MPVPLRRGKSLENMVPGVGLEPTRIAPADFKSAASASSATPAKDKNWIFLPNPPNYMAAGIPCKGYRSIEALSSGYPLVL